MFLLLALLYLDEGQGFVALHFDCFLQIGNPALCDFRPFFSDLIAIVDGGGVDYIARVILHLNCLIRDDQKFAAKVRKLAQSHNYSAFENVEAVLWPAFTPFRRHLSSLRDVSIGTDYALL